MEWQIVFLGELRILVEAGCPFLSPGLLAYARLPRDSLIPFAVLIAFGPAGDGLARYRRLKFANLTHDHGSGNHSRAFAFRSAIFFGGDQILLGFIPNPSATYAHGANVPIC